MASPTPTHIIIVLSIFCGIDSMIFPPAKPPMAEPTKRVSPIIQEIPPPHMKTNNTRIPIILTTVFFMHCVSINSS